jgi:hypothetical protein
VEVIVMRIALSVLLAVTVLATSNPAARGRLLGPFAFGMSVDDARRASGCKLRSVGRADDETLSCSRYKLGDSSVELVLRFTNGQLSSMAFRHRGISERKMRKELERLLPLLVAEAGALRSPELGMTPVSPDTVLAYLKKGRTYTSTASLGAIPDNPPDTIDLRASFMTSRGTAPTDSFWAYSGIEGGSAPVAGSGFEVVSHTIVITLRPAGPSTEHQAHSSGARSWTAIASPRA